MTLKDQLIAELTKVEAKLAASRARRPALRAAITAREEKLISLRKDLPDSSAQARKIDAQLQDLTDAWNQLNDEDEADRA